MSTSTLSPTLLATSIDINNFSSDSAYNFVAHFYILILISFAVIFGVPILCFLLECLPWIQHFRDNVALAAHCARLNQQSSKGSARSIDGLVRSPKSGRMRTFVVESSNGKQSKHGGKNSNHTSPRHLSYTDISRSSLTTRDEYYQLFLLQKKRYTGCEPWIISCCSYLLCCMVRGAFEDMIRLLCNEHLFFAMIFADPQHPYSRLKRKVSYFVITSFTFCMISLVAYYKVDERISKSGFSSGFVTTGLIISPLLLICDELMYVFFVCPCCINRCCLFRQSGNLISIISEVCFTGFGLGCYIFAIVLCSTLSLTTLSWLVTQVVLGLLVYPILEKLIVYYLPYINCPIGLGLGNGYYLSLMGSWYVEKRDRENGYEDQQYIEVLGGGGFTGFMSPV